MVFCNTVTIQYILFHSVLDVQNLMLNQCLSTRDVCNIRDDISLIYARRFTLILRNTLVQ